MTARRFRLLRREMTIPLSIAGARNSRRLRCVGKTPLLRRSAYGGGLKRSTQHVMSDARDGVDGRWVEDMFEGSTRWPRRSCGTAGGARSQFNRGARQLNERSRETLGFETRAERDLTLVLHRPIELTAQSGHPGHAHQCPLLGVKRTSQNRPVMSAYDPKRTSATGKSCFAAMNADHCFV